ncbi:hypothetical protein SGFS_023180 [Streptomyces graminofaciens]|uniref:Uncharacterized protein n=1 Tax=Streptomyces graminofaciens TaxID=68212 RepID=A0ABN5VCK4_9ACTN|nr:hypothetical protein SGFS_023180 [Streptomyces graminofaciens]
MHGKAPESPGSGVTRALRHAARPLRTWVIGSDQIRFPHGKAARGVRNRGGWDRSAVGRPASGFDGTGVVMAPDGLADAACS